LKAVVPALAALALVACGSGRDLALETQHWGDTEISVRIRPAPLRPGRAEFLVIATDANRAPASDLVISLRTHPQDPWEQAMQDGSMGVFRKSLVLLSGQQTLSLQLRRRLEETVLEFPVTVQ